MASSWVEIGHSFDSESPYFEYKNTFGGVTLPGAVGETAEDSTDSAHLRSSKDVYTSQKRLIFNIFKCS
jgi:hypothetical protein